MKRVIAVMFVVALMSGCAYTDDCKRCTELCQAATDKAAAVEQTCTNSLRASEAAAMKADTAARRAEKAADRAEAILNQHVKKSPKAMKATKVKKVTKVKATKVKKTTKVKKAKTL